MTSMIHNFTSEAAILTNKRSGGCSKAGSFSQGENPTKRARSGGVNEPSAAAPVPLDGSEAMVTKAANEVAVVVEPEAAVNLFLISPPSFPLPLNRDMFLNADEDEEQDEGEEKVQQANKKRTKGSKKTSGSSARSGDSKDNKAPKASRGSHQLQSKQQQPTPPSADNQERADGQATERAPMSTLNPNAPVSLFRPAHAFGIRGPNRTFKTPSSTILGLGEAAPSSAGNVGGEAQAYRVPGLRRRKAPPR
jgi:hypothetical protein